MTQQVTYVQQQPLIQQPQYIQQQPVQYIQQSQPQTQYVQTQVQPVQYIQTQPQQYIQTQPIPIQQQQPLIVQTQPQSINVVTHPTPKPKPKHVKHKPKHKPRLSNTPSKYAKYKKYYLEQEKKMKKYAKKETYKKKKNNKIDCCDCICGLFLGLCLFGILFAFDIAALVISFQYKDDICATFNNTSVGLSAFDIMVPGSIISMVVFLLALLCIVNSEAPWILIFGNLFIVIWASLGLNLYWNYTYWDLCWNHPVSYMLQLIY